MTKYIISIIFLAAASAFAQQGYTKVTATVLDPNGTPYANCIYSASWSAAAGTSGPALFSGSPFQQDRPGLFCDSFSSISLSLPDVTLISPAGSKWKFTICSSNGITCFAALVSISGANQNITSQIQAAAAPLSNASSTNILALNNIFSGANIFSNSATFNSAATFNDSTTFVGATSFLGSTSTAGPMTFGSGNQGTADFPSSGTGAAGTIPHTVRFQGCSDVACVSENQANDAALVKSPSATGGGTSGQVPIWTGGSTLGNSLIGNWTTAVNDSPRAKWFGTSTGTLQFAFTINEDVFTRPFTITRFTVFYPVQPAGCATNGVVDIFDLTASSSLVSLTTANGGFFYDSGAVSIAVVAGHTMLFRHKTAATGCSTYAAAGQFNMEFISQ